MNPPSKPTDTLLRGGGDWISGGPSSVRATVRYRFAPAYRDDNLGFRCALRGRSPRV